MMRALLVVNPNATATTLRTRDVLASALGSDLRVDTFETKCRGHAIELGAQAVETAPSSWSRSAATAPSTRSSTAS